MIRRQRLERSVARYPIDVGFLLPVLVLLIVGVAMVFSASFVVAHTVFGDDTYFLGRHLVWLTIGLVVAIIIANVDYRLWERVAIPLYALSIGLLALVLVPGVGSSTYGASRWINVGPLLSVQPSEVAKLALIIFLARWIGYARGNVHRLMQGTIPFALTLGLSAGLVLLEPDLGTAIVLVMTAGSVFFVAGANVLHALVGVVLGGVFVLNVVAASGYKADRIQAFLNPWADPSGIGWHTTQTLLALGSGGLTGLGLGAGRQKYFYVPNAHTDSIYAIVGEEIGFVGTALVLALFLLLAWRGLTIACGAPDPVGRALAAGATLLLVWQGLLNMAVVSHLVPMTGVPLPFLSYGGSATLVSLAAVGIVLGVSRSVSPERRSWRAWFAAAPPTRVSSSESRVSSFRRRAARNLKLETRNSRG
jgi:cell division protein FtsW